VTPEVHAHRVPHGDEVDSGAVHDPRDLVVPGHHADDLAPVLLHPLIALLDDLGPDEVIDLEVPIATPLHYPLNGDLRPLAPGGRYVRADLTPGGPASTGPRDAEHRIPGTGAPHPRSPTMRR